MALQVVTAPSYEPVSLAEARKWLRLEDDDTASTAVLQLLIKAMREDAENLTQRAFIQRTLKLSIDNWPTDSQYGLKIDLPFPPVASVTTFKYYDTDGVLQTLATDQYDLHTEQEPAFIVPAHQVTWPTIRLRPDAIQITFVAGYAPGSPPDEQGSQETLPAQVRLWMQTKLATLYENREQVIVGTIVSKVPRDFTDALLDSLIVGTRLF